MGRSVGSAVARSDEGPHVAIARAGSRDRRPWIRSGVDANLALECANGSRHVALARGFIALRAGLHRASRERRADCSDRHTYKTDIEQRFRRKQARGRLNGDGLSSAKRVPRASHATGPPSRRRRFGERLAVALAEAEARRRSGARESVSGSPRGNAPRESNGSQDSPVRPFSVISRRLYAGTLGGADVDACANVHRNSRDRRR